MHSELCVSSVECSNYLPRHRGRVGRHRQPCGMVDLGQEVVSGLAVDAPLVVIVEDALEPGWGYLEERDGEATQVDLGGTDEGPSDKHGAVDSHGYWVWAPPACVREIAFALVDPRESGHQLKWSEDVVMVRA